MHVEGFTEAYPELLVEMFTGGGAGIETENVVDVHSDDNVGSVDGLGVDVRFDHRAIVVELGDALGGCGEI